jgi:hypothetical protein
LDVAGGDLDPDNAAHMVLIYFAAISESISFGVLVFVSKVGWTMNILPANCSGVFRWLSAWAVL